MEAQGIISKYDGHDVSPEWLNSFVIVKKPTGTLRVCLDPTDLNKGIIRPVCNTQTMDDAIHKMKHARYFAVFYTSKGFFSHSFRTRIKIVDSDAYPIWHLCLQCLSYGAQQGLLFVVTHFKHFTYGRLVHIITNHKPLVSLFRKSLVDSSPWLTRMLIQLLDYTLEVMYRPGAKMHLSNAISRLSTHDNSKGTTIQNLDVSMHAIEELTGFNCLSVDRIHQHTAKDQAMQLLIDHIKNGFPESSTKLPDSIKAYFSFRDELSVCNGIILKGHNRIVVPESLRPQAINILYNKAHLGLSKTLERACMCLCWPGITDAIKDSVSACKPCLTYSSKQQHEPYVSDVVTQPWTNLSLDNFEFQGQHFIMIRIFPLNSL